MTLHVYTARITSRDPDRLDITRKSADVFGRVFAPSWAILNPALAKRKAGTFAAADWVEYAADYTREMRRSYAEHGAVWDALLTLPRVVAVCYCTDAARCHRTVLGRDILPKFGAIYEGEVTT